MFTALSVFRGPDLLLRFNCPRPGASKKLVLDLEREPLLFEKWKIPADLSLSEQGKILETMLFDPNKRLESPNRYFDPAWYSKKNSIPANVSPFMHYIFFGEAQGFRPCKDLDTKWIRDNYDMSYASQSALAFYLHNSRFVAPNPFFDPIFYLTLYPDLFENQVLPYDHYLEFGIREKRHPHALIDWTWYSRLAEKAAPNLDGFFETRLTNGIFPSPLAHPSWAHATNAELAEIFADNLEPSLRLIKRPTNKYRIKNVLSQKPTPVFFNGARTVEIMKTTAGLIERYRARQVGHGPLVSVVLPTKDRLSILKAAVSSVLNQSYNNLQLFVVDDGSSDGTREWVTGLTDPRVKYIPSPNLGVSHARNLGLNAAEGEFIAFLDSDNQMISTFIESMVAFCTETKAVFAYGVLRMYEQTGKVFYRFRKFDWNSLKKGNYIDMNAIFHRRDTFSAIRFDEDLKRCVDWDYILQLCLQKDPAPVLTLACDYQHGNVDTNRITLSRPVQDCFRVVQRYALLRPLPDAPTRLKSDHLFILPVITQGFVDTWRDYVLQLETLPSGSLVQFCLAADVPVLFVDALRRVCETFNQPEPIIAGSPLNEISLVDYALAITVVDCNRVHLILRRSPVVFQSVIREADRCDDIMPIVAVRDDGMYDILYFDNLSRHWAAGSLSEPVVQADVLPMAISLTNLRPAAIGRLNLNLSNNLALVAMLRRMVVAGHPITLIQGGKNSEITLASLLEELPSFDASEKVDHLDETLEPIGFAFELKQDQLLTKPILAPISRKKMEIGIFSPSPRVGSGWGDEHFADSMAVAFRSLGIECSVIHRENWAAADGAFAHAIHICGTVTPRPSLGARNFLWIISHPDKIDLRSLADYEEIFVASSGEASRIEASLKRNIVPLLQCTAFLPDPQLRHGSTPYPSLEQYIGFIGDSKKTLRHPLEEFFQSSDRAVIIGPNWKFDASVKGTYIDTQLPNQLLPAFYASFGIVLNQHWPDMARRGFVSNRLFDVAASGGFFITDACDGLPPELLKFGSVWEGGPLVGEEAIEKRQSRSELYEQASDFAAANSFVQRCRVIGQSMGFTC